MATIKSFSDLQQSRKLADILPLDSADNVIVSIGDREDVKTITIPKETFNILRTPFTDIRNTIPCWSLTALLGVLPKTINFGYENDSTFVLKPLENGKYLADYYEISYIKDNPIDTCVNMIEKLHELKML